MGEESHLLRDAATQICEGFANVGRIVICFIGVLVSGGCQQGHEDCRGRAKGIRDCKQFLMYLFEGIDSLLEFDVIRGKLSLRDYQLPGF